MNQRGPHDRQPDEPGWWLAADGKWYPPDTAPQPEPGPMVQPPQQSRDSEAPTQATRAKWWDQTWFFVVSLLFCFPPALLLLWRKPWSTGLKVGLTALIAAVVVASAAGAATSNPQKIASAPSTTQPTLPPTTQMTLPPTTQMTLPPTTQPTLPPTTQPTLPPTTAPSGPVETAGQANARRSAMEYLSMGSGFSRAGLIQQLSSSAGEGFSLADATYGVDATHTDWNAQACLSAKGYLKMQAFSHAGLVDQLSSAAGEGYTPAQAEYGVRCAGL
jgi:hypothetical protein